MTSCEALTSAEEGGDQSYDHWLTLEELDAAHFVPLCFRLAELFHVESQSTSGDVGFSAQVRSPRIGIDERVRGWAERTSVWLVIDAEFHSIAPAGLQRAGPGLALPGATYVRSGTRDSSWPDAEWDHEQVRIAWVADEVRVGAPPEGWE